MAHGELFERLPFLTQLPSSIVDDLDTSTLHVPCGMTARTRERLESQLNCHIMTYTHNPGRPSSIGKLHLCKLLEPACLSSEQLSLLQQAEAILEKTGVVLVAYRKPLQMRKQDLT